MTVKKIMKRNSSKVLAALKREVLAEMVWAREAFRLYGKKKSCRSAH